MKIFQKKFQKTIFFVVEVVVNVVFVDFIVFVAVHIGFRLGQ